MRSVIRLGWMLMLVLSSAIALYTGLVLLLPGFGAPFVAGLRLSAPGAVVAHLAGGLVALATGPWQFSRRIRTRRTHVHRWLGRVYVVAVVAGSLGALALAPLSQEGFVTHVGFGLLGLLWLGATIQAYRCIRKRDLPSHRDWMIRSFALTLAAVTLRIHLPLGLAAGLSFHDAYQAVAWVSWVPNLVAAEWFVLSRRRGDDFGGSH